MKYLVYDSYEEAYVADAIITLNMRLGGGTTQEWSKPMKRKKDNKYVVKKPNKVKDLECVQPTVEENYSTDWFGSE